MIEVTVKTLDSQNHPFSVDDDITVKDFKDLIAGKVNISAETQRLIYCGRVLHDDKKLKEYDVNGKVVHLVQRAPPQANRPVGNAVGQPRFQNRQQFNHHAPSLNSIYLGSMAYSADMMDAQQGIPQLPLSQNLSNSRLNVARKMLRIAGVIIGQLERNSTENTTAATDENMLIEDPIDTTPVLAAQVYVPAFPNVYGGLEQQHHDMAAAAISAALSATNNYRNIIGGGGANQNNNSPQVESTSAPETGPVPADAGTSEVEPDIGSTSDPANQMPASEAEQSTAADDATRTGGAEATANTANNSSQSNVARTTSLADLLDELNRIQTRIQPFMERYHDLMRNDPNFETEAERNDAQRVFDRVSAAMHALGHAYHALSDVLCPFNRPAPRSLLCRPTLVQHAVLQAGISLPLRVQAHVDVENNAVRNPFARSVTVNEGAPEQQSSESENIPPERAESAETPPQETTSEGPQNLPPHPPPVSFPRPPISMSRPVVAGARNVDIIVALSPEDEGITLGGIGGPNQDLIQSLVHAVTNSVMRSVNLGSGPVPVSTSFSVQTPPANDTNSSSTSSSSVNPTSVNSTDTTTVSNSSAPLHGQNSQARGNTATLPTTSTQTPRATTRPHVHLSPHSFRGFDPFLQCNSHHIGSIRSANRPQPTRQHVAREESPLETASVQVRVRSSSVPRESRDINNARSVLRDTFESTRRTSTASAPQAAGVHFCPSPAGAQSCQTPAMTHSCQSPRATQTSTQFQSVSAPSVTSASAIHGMDVDTFYDATEHGVASNDSSDTRQASRRVFLPSSGESSTLQMPQVNVGSEGWHSTVPSEWVSVVTRDVQAQRQQPPQAPYSDAYLSSVPAKRRKVISCNKPQGSLPQVISDSLRQAVLSTGLSQVAPIDMVVGAAGGDPILQAAYREELRESVRARPSHASAPEIAPVKRFPNASIFFQKP